MRARIYLRQTRVPSRVEPRIAGFGHFARDCSYSDCGGKRPSHGLPSHPTSRRPIVESVREEEVLRCSAPAPRCLLLLLSLSLTCPGGELWNGTREGMSAAKIERLFGAHVKPYSSPIGQDLKKWYTLDKLQPFCGGNFQVIFGMDSLWHNSGLDWMLLELEKPSNADGKIGDCVLAQYGNKYGPPRPSNATSDKGGHDFSGGRIWVYASPKGIEIMHRGHGCHVGRIRTDIAFGCGPDFGWPL